MLLKWGTGAGNKHGEGENEKWEQNLTLTLANLSITSFPILCFVVLFNFPVPHTRSPLPFPRSSTHNVFAVTMYKL